MCGTVAASNDKMCTLNATDRRFAINMHLANSNQSGNSNHDESQTVNKELKTKLCAIDFDYGH